MKNDNMFMPAPPVEYGKEDKFYYTISDSCVMCGRCIAECPVNAVIECGGAVRIDTETCIDCGICSAVCPAGAAQRVPFVRESIAADEIDIEKCFFNAGCALNLYKPDTASGMLDFLRENFGDVRPHNICCRHDPELPAGAVIINNCAGCDRRFRSLYSGIDTISFWEVADSIEGIRLPDYGGIIMSVHDSCVYRHKPQVHKAVRSLLKKMNIEIIEAEFHGTESVCCGDNCFGHVSNAEVSARIAMRAAGFPCDNVVVYCIGCERAMGEAGKIPYYLPDLLLGKSGRHNTDSLVEYHDKLDLYIESH